MENQFKPIDHIIGNLISIPDKGGDIVPFRLNNIQKHLHDNRANRGDVLKFRQGGITSFVMAWFLVECLYKYTRAVMIAHDKEHTEKLLQRVHFFIKTLKGPKPRIGRVNDQEVSFPKTNATFTIGTAGSKTFGRSDTITHLHCSETAFWRDPKTIITGLFQAVPHESGVIIKESTANGYGTYHHKEYMRAHKGEGRFKDYFYPWHVFEEYQSRTPLSSPLNDEEIELQREFKLSEPQLQWRREKLEEFEGDVMIFRQEYPLTIEEAFRVTGGSLFPNVISYDNPDFQKIPNPYGEGKAHILNPHPIKDYHYVFGIDSAGGTGNDYSSIQGLCLETMEQVLTYRTNVASPPDFSVTLMSFGKDFNMAYLVPEQNQHGLSVIGMLRREGPYSERLGKIYQTKVAPKRAMNSLPFETCYGFKTSQVTKYKLIGTLQSMLKDIKIFDEITADQLRGFGETDMGTLGNIAAGQNDDDVIALGLACEGARKRLIYLKTSEVEEIQEREINYKGMAPIDLKDIMSRIKTSRHGESFFENQIARTERPWTGSFS